MIVKRSMKYTSRIGKYDGRNFDLSLHVNVWILMCFDSLVNLYAKHGLPYTKDVERQVIERERTVREWVTCVFPEPL